MKTLLIVVHARHVQLENFIVLAIVFYVNQRSAANPLRNVK